MTEKKSLRSEFSKGIIKENPVLRLVLGTCPALAVSTSMVNAIGMGVAASIVLLCSNIVVSALRKVIPSRVRIPAYIVIIASFVTIVQMLVKAFVPALNDALGVYLPLIVVNCVILGRAEAFASKRPVLASAVDGIGMGVGFTAALFFISLFREIMGSGTLFSGAQSLLGLFGDNVLKGFNGIDLFSFLPEWITISPMTIFILPAGGFFVYGILIAIANKIAVGKGLPEAVLHGCEHCPMAENCTKINEEKEEVAI